MTGSEIETFAARRREVLSAIETACTRTGRDPGSVRLVAVSKTVPPERLVHAVAAGLDRLAENRVQEGLAKAPLVPGASWELVGPLQSNKARRAIETFVRIQSVDSVELAQRLDRIAGEIRPGEPLSVLLQVNVDDDPAKAGFRPADVGVALRELGEAPNLRIEGLMTIGRFAAAEVQARTTFRALRDLSERLRAAHPRLGNELSMGMSDDYVAAVEEGATIVRVGRALFGDRRA